MNTEQFLREHFSLQGEFFAKDHDFDNPDIEPPKQFTEEAWELWGKALRLLETLEKEGYIGDGKNGDFYQFFWDNLPED